MTLAAGTRLGTHEIVSPLGAGGMGEVYRARDTRLRDVAVKVLPPSLGSEPDRVGASSLYLVDGLHSGAGLFSVRLSSARPTR